MRSPSVKRARRGEILPPDERPDPAIAEHVKYIGSPEHKRAPSFAGALRPRADASICDPRFNGRQEELTEWLRTAIRKGAVGAPVEGGYPRYVWYRQDNEVFIGRLVNSGNGEYKGWQLDRQDEWPLGLDEFYA